MKFEHSLFFFAMNAFMYAGFGGHTTIKIYQKRYPLIVNDLVKKSTSFEILYQKQQLLTDRNGLFFPIYMSIPLKNKNLVEKLFIRKNKTKKEFFGINITKKEAQTPFDFDIICDSEQKFAVLGGQRKTARELVKHCTLICNQAHEFKPKTIHEIIEIHNPDMDLYKVLSFRNSMLLISKHGVVAYPEIINDN